MAAMPPSMLSLITQRQMGRDKNFFKPLRDMLASENNDTSLVDMARQQTADPDAAEREKARSERDAARYGGDTGSSLAVDDQARLAGLRRATGNVTTMNNAQMDQYALNTTRRNELLNTMRGLQDAASGSATSLLQAQNRRKLASDQAEAAEKSSQNAAIGAGVGIVIAIA